MNPPWHLGRLATLDFEASLRRSSDPDASINRNWPLIPADSAVRA